MTLIGMLIGTNVVLFCIAAFFIWSSHQNQLGWNDTLQEKNIMRLELAYYKYYFLSGCFPKNSDDLATVMDLDFGVEYQNPYDGEIAPYLPSPEHPEGLDIGRITFHYHPDDPSLGKREHIDILGLDRDGLFLNEVTVPDIDFPPIGTANNREG